MDRIALLSVMLQAPTAEHFASMYQAGFEIYANAVKAAGLKPE